MRSRSEHDSLRTSGVNELAILSEVSQSPDITQRELASRIGLSLGATNLLLQTFVRKGYLRMKRAGWRRWLYALTPPGATRKLTLTTGYVSRFLDQYRQVRAYLSEQLDATALNESGRVGVYGAGDMVRLVHLVLTEIERYGNLAIDYYERAARLRPAWPWGWSNLALVRYELYQDTSDAYYEALIHATHFGPWEAQVQRLVVDLGRDTWGSLSPDARQAVLGTIDRALQRQPLGLAAIVDSEQAWQVFCETATPDVAANGLLRLQRQCEDLSRLQDEI